ncbi:hypothetical protein MAR_013358 [Mya arenaria]|uniref:Secreted protein n=1 Tax=Mya arenaria TaxID=6604 RepID=A0ABY7G2M9_MYAAR|nr:hypothetical protein MAR_013358 [Mya arenaria]
MACFKINGKLLGFLVACLTVNIVTAVYSTRLHYRRGQQYKTTLSSRSALKDYTLIAVNSTGLCYHSGTRLHYDSGLQYNTSLSERSIVQYYTIIAVNSTRLHYHDGQQYNAL